MDLKNKGDLGTLSRACKLRYRKAEQDRARRRDLIADFAGGNYAKDMGLRGSPKTLVNLLQLMVVSLSVALAYARPRAKCTTEVLENEQFSKQKQFSLNKLIEQLYLQKILRKVVFDSIFHMGIVKIGSGSPIERVSPDDFVYDTGPGDLCKASFLADRYRVAVEDAKKDDRFDPKIAAKLTPTRKSEREDISNLTAGLSGRDGDDEGEIDPSVDLADVWVRREQKVFTFRCLSRFELDTDLGPLGDGVPWEDDQTGCHRVLSMLEVPDNSNPLPLADSVHDLFRIINILLTKMTTRAKKQRDVPIYVPGGEKDMQNVMFAGDLSPVAVSNKDNIGMMKLFGVDQQLQGFVYSLIEIFKQGAGNLDALVGLSPSADTLGQSQMVAGQVGARIAHYRNLTNEFTSQMLNDLGDHMWYSQSLVVRGQGKVPGTNYNYDRTWWPDHVMQRQGQRNDYYISVENSMEYQAPGMRFQKFQAGLQLVAPFYPAGQQQGVIFDFMELQSIVGDMLDEPEFGRIFKMGSQPGPQPQAQGGVENNQPHEYIRRSVSNGPQGDGALQTMMQQQPQGAQTEQAMSVE